MHSVSGRPAINDSEVVIRTGLVNDIDILSEIDVDAAALFARAGLQLDFPGKLEFAAAERNRWLDCLAAEAVLVAVDPYGEEVGFAALGRMDGEPYLAQISVRLHAMRRGIGTKLLNAASSKVKATGARSFWLITYNHLPWNRPFYERNGFLVVEPEKCGSAISRELLHQRRWLPVPKERIVMCKDLLHRGTQ